MAMSLLFDPPAVLTVLSDIGNGRYILHAIFKRGVGGRRLRRVRCIAGAGRCIGGSASQVRPVRFKLGDNIVHPLLLGRIQIEVPAYVAKPWREIQAAHSKRTPEEREETRARALRDLAIEHMTLVEFLDAGRHVEIEGSGDPTETEATVRRCDPTALDRVTRQTATGGARTLHELGGLFLMRSSRKLETSCLPSGPTNTIPAQPSSSRSEILASQTSPAGVAGISPPVSPSSSRHAGPAAEGANCEISARLARRSGYPVRKCQAPVSTVPGRHHQCNQLRGLRLRLASFYLLDRGTLAGSIMP